MKYSFEHDVLKWSLSTISGLGHRAKDEKNTLSSLAQVFTIIRHRISPIPRNVKVAEGFVLPQQHAAGYEQVISEIKSGADLFPRGSRRQKNIDIHVDDMLIDWNIHHLHLGTELIKNGKQKGLIQGCKEILFVLFTEDCAYVIGVYDHNSWTKKHVMLTVKNNWPELIDLYRIERAIDLEIDVSESDRLMLRNGHINVPIKLGDSVYFGPGGGVSSGGLGINEIELANIVLRAVDDLSNWFEEHKEILERKLSQYYLDVENVSLSFEVSKFILSRTFTVKTMCGGLRIHLPCSDKPASLVHPSMIKLVESDESKYKINPSMLGGFFFEERSLFYTNM